MTDKLMYIPDDYTQNYPFCILQLVVETFGHPTYSVNNLEKRYYKTLGTSVINSPVSPPSLINNWPWEMA